MKRSLPRPLPHAARCSPQRRQQRGFAILELLGALAVGSIVLLGLSTVMDNSIDDLKGQQAAYYQSQIVAAAAKYIGANQAALQAATPSSTVVAAVTLAQLKAGQFLPNGMATTNVYNQAPCVLVRQPDPVNFPGQFDALVTTTGGRAIPDREIAAIAMNAGPGSGYIASTDTATARGANWSINTSAYRSVACAGVTALSGGSGDGGHLVSNLFSDGAGQLSTDFLYRNNVPGHPELNRMNTPIRMASAALVTAGSSCLNQSGVAEAGLALDSSTRNLLTCGSSGQWSYPSQWKEPVGAYADLPPSTAGSVLGDVRMVTSLSRAFTYNGGSWVALAVDQNGDFNAPGTITAANMTASQAIVSQGTMHADGNITTNASVAAQKNVSAVKTVSGFDVQASHNVTAEGMQASDWMQAPTVTTWYVMSPGDTCHYPIWDSVDQTYYIAYPQGTLAVDSSYRALICGSDKTMRYVNGTYTP